MAKQLFLNSSTGVGRLNNDPLLIGTATFWTSAKLTETRGTVTVQVSAPTVLGPTAGLEMQGAFSIPQEWLSDPLLADFTISGTITGNLWAFETAIANNVAINFVVDKVDGATGAITQICKSVRTTEVATAAAVNNFTATPTSTACKRGDRIRVRVFADDAGTMAAGGTATLNYGGPTASANGDSWVQFTENLTFDTATPAGSTYYLTDTAAGIAPGSSIGKLASTARGSGTVNAVTNTATGPTTGIQITNTAGGTTIEWYTPPLEAVSFGGVAKLNIRGLESSASANAALRGEIAVVAADGTGATVWGRAYPDISQIELGTTDGAKTMQASGDDTSITAGQRLRFRVYLDDVGLSAGAIAAGFTATVSYNGASAAAAGDTYVVLPVTVVEQVSSTAWTQPVNDTLSLADAVVSQAAFSCTIPDTVTLADAAASARDIAQSVADTLALADLAATAAGKGAAVSDTVALADAVRFDQTVTLADTVALSDVVAQAEEIHIADTLAVSDLVDPVKTTGGVALTQPVTDTVSVADALLFDRTQTVTDTVAVADTLASQAALARALADTVSMADTLAYQAALLRTVADTIGLTDLTTPVKSTGAVDWAQPVADTVTVADQIAAQAALARTIADTVAVTDATQAERGLTRGLADTLTLADQLASLIERNLQVADTITLGDLVASQAELQRLVADSVAITDELFSDLHIPLPLPAGWITFATGDRIGVLYPGRLDTAAQTLGGISVPGQGEGELALTGVGGIATTGG